MSWVYLVIAGLLEIAWASTLKRTQGFTRLGPSVFTALIVVGVIGLRLAEGR